MGKTAVVVIGHGSRRASSNARFVDLVHAYQQRRSELQVSYGYIELAEPAMSDALRQAAADAEEVIVLPMQLFHALHVKNDIPMAVEAVRTEFPEVKFHAADALGAHPSLAALAYQRGTETGLLPAEDPDEVAVVMVGRGSSDPGANSDFYKVVRLFSEGRGLKWVIPCYLALADPRLPDALELVARVRPKHLLIVPYFLLTGVLIERIRETVDAFIKAYPWMGASIAEPLGLDERLFEVFDERIEQAITGQHALPCDTCKYRIELPGQEEHVGGLKSLLWSQRHQFTHNQTMPHEHAHATMDKHVLVCGNVDCAERGSIALISKLRDSLKARGLRKEVIVTRTACMGRCGEGPTVAVYPDGIWYRGVLPQDAEELIDEHLTGDRIVGRLVDNIM